MYPGRPAALLGYIFILFFVQNALKLIDETENNKGIAGI